MRNLTIIIILCISTTAFSQFELREIGLRMGYSTGVTFRANIEDNLSYEMQFCYRHDGAIFTMLRQNHIEMGMDRLGNWEFLYGLGAHFGFYYTDSYRIFFKEIYYGYYLFTPVVGVDGYVGIDYKLEHIPISFGISYQPHMEISLRQIFAINLWDFGLHARYRF